MEIRHGVDRSVFLVGRWAVKLPWGLGHRPIRGWLANRSEWRQRRRPDVCSPLLTLGHVMLIMPRASWPDGGFPPTEGYEGDEAKPSSWGFIDGEWRLVDYDRAWQQHDRGLVGGWYYGRQERWARQWASAPGEKEA